MATTEGHRFVPVRAACDPGGPAFDWLDLGPADRRPAILADAVRAARAAGHVPVRAVCPPDGPGAALPLSGAIFHASRCGSTLVARLLEHVAACHLVHEPPAVNDVLGPAFALQPLDRRAALLDMVLDGLGRPLAPPQCRFVVKFASWNARHLALITDPRPGLRKVFLFRDPVEILVSSLRSPPIWLEWATHPVTAGLFLGLRPSAAAGLPVLEFVARTLGETMTTVADAVERDAGRDWLLVDWQELPGAVFDRIAPHLDLGIAAEEMPRLRDLATRDAKARDGRPFMPDAGRKRAMATPAVLDAAARWMDAPHRRIAALAARMRAGQGPAA